MRRYKQSVVGLKALKKEIEHLQHLLEMAKVKLHRDFETWCNDASQRQSAHGSRKAWATPPLSPIPTGAGSTSLLCSIFVCVCVCVCV